MGKIIEGVWDCSYCGTKKIRGSIKECPTCGRMRDNSVKFYIDNPKNYVNDETAKKINKNPDWICSYCDSLNSDDNNICSECGASREDSKLNYFENLKKKQEKQQKILEEQTKILNSKDNIEPVEKKSKEVIIDSSEKSKKFFNRNTIKILSIVLATIFCVAGLTYLFIPKTESVTVDSFYWERSFTVEEYKTVEENDWSLPPGGRLLYEQTEIRSYQQVLDHYETKTRTYTEQVISHYETVVVGHRDLGNGYFEEITSQQPVYKTETKTETYEEPVYRSEPVYDTKYYYEIDKWVYKETIKSSGKDKNPKWPEYTYLNNERKGTSDEKYKIYCITKKNKKKDYTIDFDDWEKLNIGENINLKVSIFGTAELLLE